MLSLFVSDLTFAQSLSNDHQDQIIEFPDIPGYRTLKCDFHMHTVFSDGSVWPDIRVQEAIRDGLDAISITDHQGYQPADGDIPYKDNNRGYRGAISSSDGLDLIIINGAELGRTDPSSHVNAIFLKDANKMNLPDAMEALREAKRQGAFIFWCHPDWLAELGNGTATRAEMYRQLLQDGLTDGVEIVNHSSFYEEAFQIAIDNDLTFMGNSDVHGLVDWNFPASNEEHRPITLVFAKEKSEEAIKEGLENQRSAVWFGNTLIGRSEFLVPLIQQSLKAEREANPHVQTVRIENQSDADFVLENLSGYSFRNHTGILIARAHDITLIRVKSAEKLSAFDLRFRVLNALIAPDKHPEITFKLD